MMPVLASPAPSSEPGPPSGKTTITSHTRHSRVLSGKAGLDSGGGSTFWRQGSQMTKSPTIKEALAAILNNAAKVNDSVQVRPATVLWTDAEAQWSPVVDRLHVAPPRIIRLGAYEPESRQGPAIWLKCVVAGLIPELAGDNSPCVLYLPGVSRSDLRAIESCPRELQPLAELQYRGVFWTQSNGKD